MSESTLPSTETLDAGKEAERKQEAQRLLDAYYRKIDKSNWSLKPGDYPTGRAILESEPRIQIHVLCALLRRQNHEWALGTLQTILFARNLPWTAADLECLLEDNNHHKGFYTNAWSGALRAVQRYLD